MPTRKPTDTIRLAVDISEAQGEALAQMVKRFCWKTATVGSSLILQLSKKPASPIRTTMA
jgi:hypothetical protein